MPLSATSARLRLILLIALGVLGHSASAQQIPTVVTVTGRSPILGSDIVLARQVATRDAYRQAIAQSTGVEALSRTLPQNVAEVPSERHAEMSGYVERYEVVDEGERPDGVFEVVMRAWVRTGPIPVADSEARRIRNQVFLGSPGVGLIVCGDGESSLIGRMRTEMDRRINESGLRLELARILAPCPESPAACPPEFADLDILIVAELVGTIEKHDSGEGLLAGMHSYDYSLQCSIWLQQFGQVLDSAVLPGKSVATTRSRVITKAVSDLANQFESDMLHRLPDRVQETSAAVDLQIDNCSHSQADTLVSVLQALPFFHGARLDRWEYGSARVQVFVDPTVGGSSRVAQFGEWFFGPRFYVVEVGKGRVAAVLFPAGEEGE